MAFYNEYIGSIGMLILFLKGSEFFNLKRIFRKKFDKAYYYADSRIVIDSEMQKLPFI